jgi:hypothetical protein
MQSNAFILEAKLESPVIILSSSYLTLDSLLLETIQLFGDDDSALPLSQAYEVWHGSSAIIVGDSESFYDNSVSRMTLDAATNRRNLHVSSKRPAGFPHKSGQSYCTIYHAKKIAWFGYGNMDKVMSLMGCLHGIGERRNAGFGLIGSLDIFETDTDCSIALPDGTPARPVPNSLCSHHDINIQKCVMKLVTFKPDYRDLNKAKLCAIPTTHQISDSCVCGLVKDSFVYRLGFNFMAA